MTPAGRPTRGGSARVPVADIMKAYASVLVAIVIAFVAAFSLVPEVRGWLTVRDGLVAGTAMATALLAVGTGSWAYRRSTAESRLRALIPMAAVVLALQHVRWGADIVGYRLPVVSGIRLGSLMDARDLVSISATHLGMGDGTGTLVVLLVALCTMWAAIAAHRWALDRSRITDGTSLVYVVFAGAMSSLVPVMGFFGDGSLARFGAAMAELMGSGFLVLAGISAGDHRRTVAGWRRRMWAWIDEDRTLAGLPTDVG